jgi:hypothetical protein
MLADDRDRLSRIHVADDEDELSQAVKTVAARHRNTTVVVPCSEHVKSLQIGAIRGADNH